MQHNITRVNKDQKYVDSFHIYMKESQKVKVGDIVSIDGRYSFPIDIVNYQNPYGNSNDTEDLLGYVTHILERDSDNDYYIEGILLNFGIIHVEEPIEKTSSGIPMFKLQIGVPKTTCWGPNNQLSYTERTSDNFRVLPTDVASEIIEAKPSWFV